MIIALDFDGTIVDHAFPEIGSPRLWMIEKAKKWRVDGHKVILWTCREDVTNKNRVFRPRLYLTEAVDFCKSYGLEFDAVNMNLDEDQAPVGYFARKIFADVYIDDKSVGFMDDTQRMIFNPNLCKGDLLT